jgi:hypothetical protein
MPNHKKKKNVYEPPIVKEIGGVFEQAMGVSDCVTGGGFSGVPCAGGASPLGGCPGGPRNQACAAGATDLGACSAGFRATGGCTRGPGG